MIISSDPFFVDSPDSCGRVVSAIGSSREYEVSSWILKKLCLPSSCRRLGFPCAFISVHLFFLSIYFFCPSIFSVHLFRNFWTLFICFHGSRNLPYRPSRRLW